MGDKSIEEAQEIVANSARDDVEKMTGAKDKEPLAAHIKSLPATYEPLSEYSEEHKKIDSIPLPEHTMAKEEQAQSYGE